MKEYFKNLKVEDIRINFRLRTKMIDAKFNFRNKAEYGSELWSCDSCEKAIESQSHLMWCPAYQNLRKDKLLDSDTDIVNYIKQVMQIRQDLKLRR